jgi:Ca-activated chloride channel family protein
MKRNSLLTIALAVLAGCSDGTNNSAKSDATFGGPSPGAGNPAGPGGISPSPTMGAAGSGGSGGSGGIGGGGGTPAPTPAPGTPGTTPPPSGSFGNVGTSGGQDFAVFRRALDDGRIPPVDSLDAAGFFAEHYTTLPTPTCGRAFCLHGMVSVSKDLARGGTLTLLQMGMNSTIDPATVKKPPLDLAVVLDHSGSMAAAGKMDFAKEGVRQLIEALGPEDVFTLIVFDDHVNTVFGPAKVTDKAALEGMVGEIAPAGGTDIYGGLDAGYRAVLGSNGGDTEQRRVIFLTDGLPTAGIQDLARIRAMSLGYNQQYVGLTTIGLGSDVNVALLRGLAETGGGNFYYIEKPEAVREVFMEELTFFVAPIAYDLELTFSELPGYALRTVHGTALWQTQPGGGKVSVPSVFLVSRTSSAPGPNGGRRGGGSAILAELSPTVTATPLGGVQNVGQLTLKYRIPGQQGFETQSATVSYTPPGPTSATDEVPEFYSTDAIEKNTLILDFFIALREATLRAQADPRAALAQLTGFQTRMTERLTGRTDEDLADDLKIVGKYLTVLQRAAGSGP